MEEETVYVNVVDTDNQCTNEKCHTEILRLEHDISQYEAEILEAKDLYHKLLVANLEKDVTIEELQQQLKKSAYVQFNDKLTYETIEMLKSLNDLPRQDSTFIFIAVKDLYHNNLHRLVEKTYSGRKKEPMTPEKKNVLSALFAERLKDLPNSAERMKNFGKCVKAAIDNINKSKLK